MSMSEKMERTVCGEVESEGLLFSLLPPTTFSARKFLRRSSAPAALPIPPIAGALPDSAARHSVWAVSKATSMAWVMKNRANSSSAGLSLSHDDDDWSSGRLRSTSEPSRSTESNSASATAANWRSASPSQP